MGDLRWSWLAAPYFVCVATIAAVAVAAALIRGDRVLRIGVVGAAVAAIPWALCQALAALTDDPVVAMRVLKLGQGPVALVGPNILLVLLGVSGQLERHRWVARIAHTVGMCLLIIAWSTSWIVPGVQLLSSGMFYIQPGPLTGVHISELVVWLAIGLALARRSMPPGERGRSMRLLLAVLVCGAIGSLDTLLLYRIWSGYPIAWLPATISAGIALYLVLGTPLLRPQGLDRGVALELGGFAIAVGAIAVIVLVLRGAAPIAIATAAGVVWSIVMAVTWSIARSRPVRVAGERALEQFVARVAAVDHEKQIAERLAALWQRSIGIAVRQAWAVDGETLVAIGSGDRWPLDRELAAWLVARGDAIAVTEFATTRLGSLREKIESLGTAHGAALIVPLVDRGELVGLVEANYEHALRDSERGLIAESARAAARALTFIGLARAAARERETAREVEVADALRLQASASRDAELGRWAVAAEYRTAPRTTGAGWSAIELADGRLALLATEAQAHGVAAALATAALTGAFAAATARGAESATRGATLTLDELLAALQASADGVMRGGEPVATFVAILDAPNETIEWACAGHPGAFVVGPIAGVDAGLPLGSGTVARPKATPLGPGTGVAGATRGTAPLPADTLLVVASTALRGTDDARWESKLREVAPASGRLASVLVDNALRAGAPAEDLLAVVVRAR